MGSRTKITAKVLMMGAAASVLTACGGGGGGGGGGPGGGVTTPAPPPATMLLAPLALISGSSAGSAVGSDANSIAITDPDAPNASTYGALKIDGDETVRVRFSANGLTSDETFDAATFKSDARIFTGFFSAPGFAANQGQARQLAGLQWSSGSRTLALIRLEEGAATLGVPVTTGDSAEWITAVRWTSGASRGFGLLGELATAVPTTGAARFRGEAIGSVTRSTGASIDFWGRAGLDVDFAAGTVRGGVEDIALDYGGGSARYDFNYQGALVGGKFDTTTVWAPFQASAAGSVRGQLYGAGSDLEAGGVFELSMTDGKLAGVFVAGRPTADGLFGAAPITLRPSLTNILYDATGSNATYNQNNIELGGNNELVEFTPGGFGANDDSYKFYFDNGASFMNFDFTPANYKGVVTTNMVRPGSYVPTNTHYRWLQADQWAYTPTVVLNRYRLGMLVDNTWIQPALVQALEYVNTGISPGMTHRAYLQTGARASAPTSGTARYRGESVGVMTDNQLGERFRTTSRATVDVLFGSGQVRGVLDNITRYYDNGATAMMGLDVTELVFNGSVNGARGFDAVVDNQTFYSGMTPSTLTGHVRGDFYGQTASEIGGVYDINIGALGSMAGVFVGGRNPLTLGIGYVPGQVFTDTPGDSLAAVTTAPLSNIRFAWTRNGPSSGDDTGSLQANGGPRAINVTFSSSYAGQNTEIIGEQWSLQSLNGLNTTVAIPNAYVFASAVERVSGVDLGYASLVSWKENLFSDQSTFIAVGQRTLDMPTAGTATYAGRAYGELRNGSGVLANSQGDATMSVNFATASLTGVAKNEIQASGVPDMGFTFKGAITGAQFSGDFANADNSLAGPVKGLFAGPGAAEAAATFSSTTAPSGTSFHGGLVVVKK
jgi:hypothetical protein